MIKPPRPRSLAEDLAELEETLHDMVLPGLRRPTGLACMHCARAWKAHLRHWRGQLEEQIARNRWRASICNSLAERRPNA